MEPDQLGVKLMKKVLIAQTVLALAFASSAYAANTTAVDGTVAAQIAGSAKSDLTKAGKQKEICDR